MISLALKISLCFLPSASFAFDLLDDFPTLDSIHVAQLESPMICDSHVINSIAHWPEGTPDEYKPKVDRLNVAPPNLSSKIEKFESFRYMIKMEDGRAMMRQSFQGSNWQFFARCFSFDASELMCIGNESMARINPRQKNFVVYTTGAFLSLGLSELEGIYGMPSVEFGTCYSTK